MKDLRTRCDDNANMHVNMDKKNQIYRQQVDGNLSFPKITRQHHVSPLHLGPSVPMVTTQQLSASGV